MIALELSTFLGRFHPLFVHLPIGFLLLAICIEWYQKRKEASKASPLISYAWLLGAISAVIAAICGWLLAESGNYIEDEVFWHRWLGVLLAVVATAGWWIKRKPKQFSKLGNNAVAIAVVALLIIEGHLGGNLTHGADYLLEYAPQPLKKLFAENKEENTLLLLTEKDSVKVYEHMIYPIMESKCVGCHNDEEQRGGLNMTHVELFQEGGENGPVVISGNTLESELFRRVTLSQKNEKYMPPQGEPLTYDEIKVLEWWINTGGDFETSLMDHEVPASMQPVILRLYGLDTEPKPWYESVTIPAADSLEILELQKSGFTVRSLGQENPLLDIKFSGGELSKELLSKLENVKEHITWLSLAQSNVQDDWLATVGGFPNLTRLQLEKTTISDAGVAHLGQLEHLEALNLYGTAVTDASLEHIKGIPSLKRVYLWGTKVSQQGAKELQEAANELEVIGGVTAN